MPLLVSSFQKVSICSSDELLARELLSVAAMALDLYYVRLPWRVLNVHPDSFYSGSCFFFQKKKKEQKREEMGGLSLLLLLGMLVCYRAVVVGF